MTHGRMQTPVEPGAQPYATSGGRSGNRGFDQTRVSSKSEESPYQGRAALNDRQVWLNLLSRRIGGRVEPQ